MTRGPDAVGLGVDVGGTKILVCATLSSGEVIDEATTATPASVNELFAAVRSAFDEILSNDRSAALNASALGIALPGLIDRSGTLHAAPNLGAPISLFAAREVLARPLAEHLRRFGVDVDASIVLDNDATCAAVAEVVAGAATGVDDAVVISVGTGIGAGVLANGRVVRGERSFAGELGHMIVDPNGPACLCGRHGCWEVFASGSALGRLATEEQSRNGTLVRAGEGREPEEVRGEDLIEAARRGEPGANAAVDRYAEAIAIGLTNVVEIFDPARIVLGGGVFDASDVLLPRIEQAVRRLSRSAQARDDGFIVVAHFGSRAGAVGAALLALGRVR